MLIALLLGPACMRAGAQAVPPTVHACESITSDQQRLACFDHELAKLESAQTKPSTATSSERNSNVQASAGAALPEKAAADTNTTAHAAKSLPPEQTFGLSGDQIRALEARQGGTPPPVKLKKLTAQIASVSRNSVGRWVIKLDNGQVWRQTETRSFEASPGEAVRISTGAMGTYWLETGPHNWTRVERVLSSN